MDDLPPPIKITPNSPNTPDAGDDSLVDIKVKNPFAKFLNWIKSLIKNEGIKITIKPLTAIAIAVALTGGGGIAGGVIVYFFPHSSPFLHRSVIYQGNIQKTPNGFILTLPNSDLYTLKPKSNTSINFKSLSDGLALVKGNLTPEKFVIEVSEIIYLGNPTSDPPNPSNIPDASAAQVDGSLPDLYPNLQWETNQKRVLIFTSGKRKIEQEGISLESAQVAGFPQDFINYYIESLKAQGFKETLNSINPEGVTVTYAKDDLFLTFGIKNIYKGSGDQKQLAGYRAFIEHN